MITQIKKRDGSITNYNQMNIFEAIRLASRDAEQYVRIYEVIEEVEDELLHEEEIVHVEMIQDKIEEVLLRQMYFDTARTFIKYREQKAQQRKLDIFSKRVEMKPYEYPGLMDFADAIRQSYWLHTEFSYTSDIQDYHTKLEPHEKTAVTNSMLAISQVEVDVKTFWGDLYHKMPKYEVGAVGATFSDSETRHAEAYSHLLEILGLNDEFSKIKDIPALRDRVNYLSKAVAWARTGEDKDFSLSMILFSLFIEHVSLFSQFLIMMSFNKHDNTLSGLSNVIEATSKEEQIHGLFGIELVNIIRFEHPEWFDEEMSKAVYDACNESFEAEKKVVDWIFEDGELEFMSKDVVLEFIKNRLNNSLESVGFEKLFEIDEELVKETDWFDDEVIGTKLNDFFNKRSTNYTKFNKSITAENLFSPLSEIELETNVTKERVDEILRSKMIEL